MSLSRSFHNSSFVLCCDVSKDVLCPNLDLNSLHCLLYNYIKLLSTCCAAAERSGACSAYSNGSTRRGRPILNTSFFFTLFVNLDIGGVGVHWYYETGGCIFYGNILNIVLFCAYLSYSNCQDTNFQAMRMSCQYNRMILHIVEMCWYMPPIGQPILQQPPAATLLRLCADQAEIQAPCCPI